MASAGFDSARLSAGQEMRSEDDHTAQADAAIEAALTRVLPEFRMDEVPFEVVVDWFRELMDVNVHVCQPLASASALRAADWAVAVGAAAAVKETANPITRISSGANVELAPGLKLGDMAAPQ